MSPPLCSRKRRRCGRGGVERNDGAEVASGTMLASARAKRTRRIPARRRDFFDDVAPADAAAAAAAADIEADIRRDVAADIGCGWCSNKTCKTCGGGLTSVGGEMEECLPYCDGCIYCCMSCRQCCMYYHIRWLVAFTPREYV